MGIKIKYVVAYCIACIIVFVLFVKFFLFQSEDLPVVDKDTVLNDWVEDIKVNRGVTTINGNYVILSAKIVKSAEYPVWLRPRIPLYWQPKNSKYTPFIVDVTPPYYLLKNKNEMFLTIVKKGDTLTFELFDPNASTPNDPTIKEFFQRQFKKIKD